MRHYVGNRRQLITAIMTELVHRYEHSLRLAVGTTPNADDLIATLFGATWNWNMQAANAAFDVLVQQAVRNADTPRT